MIKTINVTAHDIAKGEQKQCTRCPVARAVLRAAIKAGWYGVSVGYETASFYKNATTMQLDSDGDVYGEADQSVKFPEFVSDWIDAFDESVPVTPFKFTLHIPECVK